MNERRRWWREPLLHFLILGTLVFVAHDWLFGRSEPEYVLAEDAPIAQLREDWRAARGVLPSAEEEAVLIDEWLEEEVLYRRAVELGLDRRDTLVRRRLAQRMRFLLEDTRPPDTPTDAQLRAWLEAHRAHFMQPARTTFEHVFLSRSRRGASLAKDAKRAMGSLLRDPEAAVGGDPFFRGAKFEGVTALELRRAFGRELADAVAEVPIGRWSGPISSAYGLHLVFVEDRTTPPPPALETIRGEVLEDWLASERARLNDEALERLKARYAPMESK